MSGENGNGLPSWPERRARRTNANAALADFRKECADYASGERKLAPDWPSWALRLADLMSMLIPCVDDKPPAAEPEPAPKPIDAMIAALDAEPDYSDGIDPRTWREVFDAGVVSVEDIAHAYARRIAP